MARRLAGFSMAFVAEFVKSVKMKYKRNSITTDEAITILDSIRKHKQLCEEHFKEPRKVGFFRRDAEDVHDLIP